MNICVIGAGNWGKNHIDTLSSLDALAGVVEIDKRKINNLKETYPDIKYFDSLDKAIGMNFDGYIVCTPSSTHASIAKVIINNKAFSYIKPKNQIKLSSKYISLVSQALNGEKIYSKKLDQKIIESQIRKNFTLCWKWFYQMQIPLFIGYHKFMKDLQIDKALKEVFELITEVNVYVDNQAPWSLKKTDIERMNVVLTVSIELIKRSSFMLIPVIPTTCIKIFELLNINYKDLRFDNLCTFSDKSIKINKPEPLFPRIQSND